MKTIEIARRLAELKQVKDAQQAYALFLQKEDADPMKEFEAASYIFFSQGDYKVSYTAFVSLYNRGFYQDELMNIMTQAFYVPNLEKQEKQYASNCRRLQEYPYLFRKDFLPFEDLPIQFFPFDNQWFIPFYLNENRFGKTLNFCDPVIDRYFFKDLENPILAKDVFSQYQLEYLNDTVRKSEWVGRENHIYLHYSNWAVFCAHLQCLDFSKLLKHEKLVFLIEDEIAQYPIDFQSRFGIDYSQYPVKPVGVREINRLIWHTQLSTHNGGDFFNEIFHAHPNLLALESVMFDNVRDIIKERKKDWKAHKTCDTNAQTQLLGIKHPTDKDFLVALFLDHPDIRCSLDETSRIAPAIFFQPHFPNVTYEIHGKGTGCVLHSEMCDKISKSPILNQFKYIKTFTPMRRITTSYAASNRFSVKNIDDPHHVIRDTLSGRVLNRSYMVDFQDRLYRDSILVRFEDGKLNPKATFTALAEFLDIPYTESMTYCSGRTGINPESMAGNALGFDPAPVYRTYDDYANDADRAYLEYFMRDAYEMYGYDFHYYKGEPVDEAWITEKAMGADHLDKYIKDSYAAMFLAQIKEKNQSVDLEKSKEAIEMRAQLELDLFQKNRVSIAKTLMQGLHFVNRNGQPLHFMKKLELDPDLLEQPLYH